MVWRHYSLCSILIVCAIDSYCFPTLSTEIDQNTNIYFIIRGVSFDVITDPSVAIVAGVLLYTYVSCFLIGLVVVWMELAFFDLYRKDVT